MSTVFLEVQCACVWPEESPCTGEHSYFDVIHVWVCIDCFCEKHSLSKEEKKKEKMTSVSSFFILGMVNTHQQMTIDGEGTEVVYYCKYLKTIIDANHRL